MSFLYPHQITLKRPHVVATVGDRGYSADRGAANEDELYADVQCSIQEFVNGPRSPVGLPADAKVQSQWRIMIPRGAGISLALGTFKATDVAYDTSGQRYVVWSAISTSLGWELGAVMVEK